MATRVIDTDARERERDERDEDGRDEDERWIDDESEVDGDRGGGGRGADRGWDDDEPLAPRPRGRLLRPVPLALLALIIAAAGFIGGIEAQKGSEGAGAAAGPGGGSVPSFAALKEGAGGSEAAGEGTAGEGAAGGSEATTGEGAAGGSESGGGLPSFGASAATASGTVTAVEGHTIYVKESDGTTVAVKAGDGSTVTRDSNVAAKKIHPGDTVVVQGSKKGSTVTASSIAATEAGVESTAGPTAAASPTAATESGGEAETSVESLFEE